MLVNTRKLIFIVVFFIGGNVLLAQEVWTLHQCLDTAQAYNKNLQINRNIIALSQERAQEARANLIPKLMVNADYKYFAELPYQYMPLNALNPQAPEGTYKEIQFGVPHNINANLQLVMPLYNTQVYGGIQNTKIANEISQLQYVKTEEQVLFDITTLFYNAQILKHQLLFIDSNLTNTNKLLANIQMLHEQLLALGTDVNKVKLQADKLATQKDIISNSLNQVLNALKLNMGVAAEKNIDINSTIDFQVITDYTNHTSTELQIVMLQNKLLQRELKTLHQSQFLPALNFIASYGTTGFGYHESPNSFFTFYPVSFAGIQLSYPLFNGTVTQRKMNQKTWEIKNNELYTQALDDKNKMEIDNAKRQKSTALLTISNTNNQLSQAQNIYEQTLLQQKQGTASLTDVLLADHELRAAQQAYLSAIIDYLKAELDVLKRTGNLNTLKN